NTENRQLVWVRPLDSIEAHPLPGSEGGELPFWSADSRYVAFFAVGTGLLKKIDIAGGPPQTVGDIRDSTGTWNSEGVILIGSNSAGRPLNRIAESGGTPSPVTALDTSAGESFHAFPHFLPDGHHFLYLAENSKPELNAIYAGSLDS